MSENYHLSLTPPENENYEGEQNICNVNQMTLQSNQTKFDLIASIIMISFFILFMLLPVEINIFTKGEFLPIFFFSLIILILIIAIILLVLFQKVKKINLIKNESYNLLTVKIINFLNCSKSIFNFNLKDVILDIIKYQIVSDGEVDKYEALVITNTFQNDKDIDLNLSNIKNKPIRNIYHIFPKIKLNNYTTISLRNFIDICPETENPVFFNINKYMGKSYAYLQTFSSYNLSRYMKISDYFFTYYFKESCCYRRFNCIIILILLILFLEIVPIIGLIYSKNDILIYVMMLIAILIIASIILIFSINAIKKYSLRMDIIFSQNFDTIFIALLNYNGTSYKKTFIYDMNCIERFILESYNNSDNISILKVIYKNKNVEDIFRIDECQYNLEGLLFILNEKINKYPQI